jgi:predicted transport protein
MPRAPIDMMAAVARNLPEKTGKTLEDWVDLAKREGPSIRKERVAWLKSTHGLGHSTASIITAESMKADDYIEPTPDELVATQYAGEKSALRPIYERIVAEVEAIGDGVQIEPRQTYVALTRGRQFAVIQPSTKTRVDLGLVLASTQPTERLRAAGSFGSGRITHRLALSSVDDLDHEALAWLRQAYAEA